MNWINPVVNLKVNLSQPAITCSKLTIETLEQGVKYVQKLAIKIPERFEQVNDIRVYFDMYW